LKKGFNYVQTKTEKRRMKMDNCVMCSTPINQQNDMYEWDEEGGIWCMSCAEKESDGGNE
jgi:hypothetical protein